MSEKSQPQAPTELCKKLYLLLCGNFNDALTYLPSSLFSFKSSEHVVLYIILLEVALKLSRFCKMAQRSKVVGPHCVTR